MILNVGDDVAVAGVCIASLLILSLLFCKMCDVDVVANVAVVVVLSSY